ncbi:MULTISPECIES: phosphatase PAP2 family protein [unclassified Halomonas]|uniref:phosphatase PAP2 family protein n=1 Tax=unclassified Halomonas TaxID=2609666 RepID=UPI00209D5382|nr:phosphatase PAP2 family protein [Halomonas sp. 707D7]MCP1325992.1 phosphatase PAP2 family protein [Halomonas sp. 707D4]
MRIDDGGARCRRLERAASCPLPAAPDDMDALNLALFELLNSPSNAPDWLVTIATLCASDIILVVPALLVLGWLLGDDASRRPLFEAFVATLLALGVSGAIGALWPMPRPFMVPVGEYLLEHAATPAFPSNHLTIMLTMAFSLTLHDRTRRLGHALLVAAVPVAWARVYLGVHFPRDMIGALMLAPTMAALTGLGRAWLVTPPYERVVLRCHRTLFAPLIARGWVRR